MTKLFNVLRVFFRLQLVCIWFAFGLLCASGEVHPCAAYVPCSRFLYSGCSGPGPRQQRDVVGHNNHDVVGQRSSLVRGWGLRKCNRHHLRSKTAKALKVYIQCVYNRHQCIRWSNTVAPADSLHQFTCPKRIKEDESPLMYLEMSQVFCIFWLVAVLGPGRSPFSSKSMQDEDTITHRSLEQLVYKFYGILLIWFVIMCHYVSFGFIHLDYVGSCNWDRQHVVYEHPRDADTDTILDQFQCRSSKAEGDV
jgi:hypothetical protein